MSGRGGFKRVMLVTTAAAVPVLVVAACTIQLRGDSDGPPARSSASRATNPLGAELERCRKVTSEQVAELQECRLIWAENRRRFLGSKKTPAAYFRRCSTRQPDTVVGAAQESRSSSPGLAARCNARTRVIPWVAPASSTDFWKRLPAISTAASGCLATKSPSSRPRLPQSISRSPPCSGPGVPTRTSSLAS